MCEKFFRTISETHLTHLLPVSLLSSWHSLSSSILAYIGYILLYYSHAISDFDLYYISFCLLYERTIWEPAFSSDDRQIKKGDHLINSTEKSPPQISKYRSYI